MRLVRKTKVKWAEASVLVICIALFVTDVLGPRLLNLKSQNPFLMPQQLKSFFRFAGSGIVVLSVLVMCYKDWLLKRLSREKLARRGKLIARLFYWLVAAGIVLHFLSFTIRLAYVVKIQNIQLSDVFRSDCLDALGSILLFIYILLINRESIDYLTRTKVTMLVAGYYLRKYDGLLKDGRIEEAGEAIDLACETAPSDVTPWVVKAVFAQVYLDSPAEADECFEKATENLNDSSSVSDEEKANYEYCKAMLLLREGISEKVLFHIKQSLGLQYNEERAAFLEKLEKTLRNPEE